MIQAAEKNSEDGKIRRIVVLGGGTAGFLSAIALNRNVPDAEVVMVRSTKMGVIGVGEGTIPSVVHFLHHFLGLDTFEMFKKVEASPKLGIHYLWGPRPFFNYTFSGQLISPHRQMKMPRGYYCDELFDFADLSSSLMNRENVCIRNPNGSPRYNPNIAYHLENKKFVAFMEEMADREGIEKIDDKVANVVQDEQGVKALVLESGQTLEGDFFIDCSGFRAEIIGKVLNEKRIDFSDSLFCDKAVVGGWERTDEIYHPYTTAETMDAGWCWRIEHDHLINRGYVFSSKFISDDQAIAEYQEKNPKIMDPRVIQFDSGVYERSWVKNVVAIGNSAGFVEPLEATAIGLICDAALRVSKALSASNGQILESQQRIYNRITLKNWLIIKDFLALHYKFNTRLDTPFWNAAIHDVDIGDAQEYVDYFKDVGPDFAIMNTELKRDFFTAEGYLVMLVGQKVPFHRNVEITDDERKTWNRFKQSVDQVAAKGFSVPEFLKMARSDSANEIFGLKPRTENPRKQGARVGESVQTGELNWH